MTVVLAEVTETFKKLLEHSSPETLFGHFGPFLVSHLRAAFTDIPLPEQSTCHQQITELLKSVTAWEQVLVSRGASLITGASLMQPSKPVEIKVEVSLFGADCKHRGLVDEAGMVDQQHSFQSTDSVAAVDTRTPTGSYQSSTNNRVSYASFASFPDSLVTEQLSGNESPNGSPRSGSEAPASPRSLGDGVVIGAAQRPSSGLAAPPKGAIKASAKAIGKAAAGLQHGTSKGRLVPPLAKAKSKSTSNLLDKPKAKTRAADL